MGLHGSRQGEKERQGNEMDFSFFLLIHFIFRVLNLFQHSIDLRFRLNSFLSFDFTSLLLCLTQNRNR